MRKVLVLLTLLSGLALAAPALAWESNFSTSESARRCIVFPDGSSFVLEMEETAEGEHKLRLYLPPRPRRPPSTWYFIAVEDGTGIRSRAGHVEGPGVVQLVEAMLASRYVRLGDSHRGGPLREKKVLSLKGFEEEYRRCLRQLGWADPEPEAPPTPEPQAPVP